MLLIYMSTYHYSFSAIAQVQEGSKAHDPGSTGVVSFTDAGA